MKKNIPFLTGFILIFNLTVKKDFQFAHITCLHIGFGNTVEDIRRTVHDINQNNNIRFVTASGDITEFDPYEELVLAVSD